MLLKGNGGLLRQCRPLRPPGHNFRTDRVEVNCNACSPHRLKLDRQSCHNGCLTQSRTSQWSQCQPYDAYKVLRPLAWCKASSNADSQSPGQVGPASTSRYSSPSPQEARTPPLFPILLSMEPKPACSTGCESKAESTFPSFEESEVLGHGFAFLPDVLRQNHP